MDELYEKFLQHAPRRASSPCSAFDAFLQHTKQVDVDDGDDFTDSMPRKCLFPSDLSVSGIFEINDDEEIDEYFQNMTDDFEDKEFSDAEVGCDDEIMSLLKKALPTLRKYNLLADLARFLKLVSEDKFPMNNIALLLFLDVVRFYSCRNASSMRYRKESLLFWIFGYLLFHGKWVRFSRGLKFSGCVVDGSSQLGHMKVTERTKINFAVPSDQILKRFLERNSRVPRNLKPGVVTSILEAIPEETKKSKQFVLSFDGKLIRSGLTEESGDIDMAGIEASPTFAERKIRLQKEMEVVKELQIEILNLNASESVSSLTEPKKSDVLSKLQQLAKILTMRIKEIRELKRAKEYNCKKMIDSVGGESKWRNSKLVNAISRVKCEILQANSFLSNGLELNKRVCLIARAVVGIQTPVCLIEKDELNKNENMICLRNLHEADDVANVHPLHVKQGTEHWFRLRKLSVFTGSTLYNGLGLFRLGDQQEFLRAHLKKEERRVSDVIPRIQRCLDWGKANERNAAATVISYALPLYYPGATFVESGASFIRCEITGENLVEVSADGMICNVDELSGEIRNVLAKVELKCPFPDSDNDFKLPVYYEVPKRYALQLIAEMEAEPHCESLIFACYSPGSTVISRVIFDNELWLLIKIEIKSLLSQLKEQKVPTQRSLLARERLPKKIEEFLNNCVEVLIEVPSVSDIGRDDVSHMEDATTPYIFPNKKDRPNYDLSISFLDDCVSKMGNAIKNAYELARRKAKELYVALLAPSDRSYDPEKPLFFPVFYGNKDNMFSRKEKRAVYDTIMDACLQHDIDVLVTAFDGECFQLITEDINGNPLTLIQLQHVVFEEAKKTDKKEIIRKIISLAKNAFTKEDMVTCKIDYLKTGKVSIGSLPLPKNPWIELTAAVEQNRKARQSTGTKEVLRRSKPTKEKKRRALENPKSLSQLAKSVVEAPSYYKAALTTSFAKIIWPKRLNQWMQESPILHGITGCPALWFSIPETNEKRKRLEHKIWDSTHIMTNMRRVVCTSTEAGLKKEAWLSASRDPGNKLKPSMVEDLPDKQDIGFAITTFSKEVELSMTNSNFHQEATFCRLIRNWWLAEDEPGIPAKDRVRKRMELRNFMLKDVDFGLFPPITTNVKGIPRKLFEGLISSIDTKLQLYALANDSYNTRSVSSLISENFFSSLIELDTSGTGYLRAQEIPRCMGTACTILDIRLNPERVFQCKTTKSAVYRYDEVGNIENENIDESTSVSTATKSTHFVRPRKISSIEIRDHFFDEASRKRTAGKRKLGTLSKFGAPPRKAQPTRSYHKCDESKILPEKLFSDSM